MKVNKKIRNKILLVIIICSITNVLCLTGWFLVKISPIFNLYNSLSQDKLNEYFNNEYDSIKILNNDIDKLEKNYNIDIVIESYNGTIINNKSKSSNIISSFLVKVNTDYYILKINSLDNINTKSIIISLILFQMVLMIIWFVILYLISRKIIFKPLNNILNGIKNSRFGKKVHFKNTNGELGLISRELDNLNNQIEVEHEEQTRIIASISHDIKTPLTSIIGYSELMQDKDIDINDLSIYPSKIHSKALNIRDLLYTFDDYLINKENITLKLSLVQVKDLVKQIKDDYALELENNNIKFIINSNCDKEYINIDILKIKRVIANIISNSVRYIDNNGIINIDITKEDNYVCFKIKDNGPGVDNTLIDRIFDPLYTTDNSRQIHGLGLSICKEFILLHNGKIKAYNDNGLVIEFKLLKTKK